MSSYPRRLPRLNYQSYCVIDNCEGKLLPHQFEALTNLKERFKVAEPGIAIVSMPTGSGKTGVMCCLPYFLGSIGLQRGPNNEATGTPVHLFDKPILVIAPDLAITDQLERQMVVTKTDLEDQPFLLKRGIVPAEDHREVLPVGVKIQETVALTTHEMHIENKDVVITNIQKFLGDEWRNTLRDDRFRLVIVDEAHHHPAKTWYNVIKKVKHNASVVFFTATPYRTDKKPVLDPLNFVYHLPLRRAIADGIIRQTWFHEVTGLDTLQDTQGPLDDDETKRFAIILQRVVELQIRKDNQTPLPDGVPHMAMAIASNTTKANGLVQLWERLYPDAPAFAYHSGVSDSDRATAMDRLKKNELKLVVVVAMLKEGFDHPPISIAAITMKIGSPVKFVQFVGRAQRIVRGSQDPQDPEVRREVNGIADIVTHEHYEQRQNYDKFINETLIRQSNDE